MKFARKAKQSKANADNKATNQSTKRTHTQPVNRVNASEPSRAKGQLRRHLRRDSPESGRLAIFGAHVTPERRSFGRGVFELPLHRDTRRVYAAADLPARYAACVRACVCACVS